MKNPSKKLPDRRFEKKRAVGRKLFVFLVAALAFLVLFAGAAGVFYLIRQDRDELYKEGKADARTLAATVKAEFDPVRYTVRLLAHQDEAIKTLAGEEGAWIKELNRVLDVYQRELTYVVCYVLDSEGIVIASSNRRLEDSFVGHDYSFRPYFRKAMGGQQGEYLAEGVTSGRMGFYSSYPVYTGNGDISGVAVIKKQLDDLQHSFGNYNKAFMTDRMGVVFLSSDPHFISKTLLPVSPVARDRLSVSRKYGDASITPLFEEFKPDGSLVRLRGGRYILSRARMEGGKMVYVLKPAFVLIQMAFIGGGAVLLLFLLLLMGSVFIWRMDRAVQHLDESESKFRLLTNAADEGIVIHAGGRILDHNDRFAQLFGYEGEELFGKSLYTFIASGSLDKLRANVEADYDKPYTAQCVKKDGGEFLAEILGKSFYYRGKKTRIVTIRDVTAQRRYENELKASREFADRLIKYNPSAIFTVDRSRRVTSWNRKAEEITGYSRDEVIGKSCDLFAGSPCDEECGLFSEDTEVPITGRECTIKTRSGEERVISKNVDHLRGPDGEVIGGLESFEDITDRKNAAAETEKAYEYMNQIFENAGDGMCLISAEAEVIKVNGTFLAMAGLPEDYNGFENVPPDRIFNQYMNDIIRESLKEVLKGRERIQRDIDINRRGGHSIPCIMTATPFYDTDGNIHGMIATFKDISERKSAEKALLENVRLKTNFTSMVSHELRTPLTAIKEGIGIVLDGATGDVNEEQKDFLSTAKNNVDRLARLINDVLDFTKLRSGKMSLKRMKGDIGAAVREVVSAQEPVAGEKGLYLRTEMDEDIPPVVFDMDRIIQVLTNLVNNALKFTEEGGITIKASRKSDDLVVSVEDTGPGIKREDMPRLFKEFQQLEGENERKTGSSGLGLSICREIIAQHGGRTWVESEYGEGSSFKFSIPLERAPHILVIDDDPTFCDVCRAALERQGLEVRLEKSGVSGMESLMNERPDLLIVDLKLPDMNGYEIIGRLRSDKYTANIPIIAVSGYSEELEKIEIRDEFSIVKLKKPFDVKDLISAVSSLLQKVHE